MSYSALKPPMMVTMTIFTSARADYIIILGRKKKGAISRETHYI
jgi:hypothetical protein